MNFYLIGVKGVGMCSLAGVLVDLGHHVRGCDYKKNFFTSDLLRKEIIIDDIENFKIVDNFIYIIGNAFYNSNYIDLIDKSSCRYYDYPDFIEQFFRMQKISISGTHGKTTTTSFISQLTNKNINLLCGDGIGVGNKEAEYLILEACEYKEHFLKYTNKILLINNIELDHPDYYKSIDDVVKSFQKAANNSKIVIVNGDDNNCNKIRHYNLIKFGMNKDNDIVFDYKNNVVTIVFYGNAYEFNFNLGLHNAYNFVASFIITKLIDTTDDYIYKKLINIKLPCRRLEKYIVGNSIVYDDYAHHPTEIKATLTYLKEIYKENKIILFFQPHTYSRTKALLNEFIESLSLADETYILDVFGSIREKGNENLLLEKTSFKKFDYKMIDEIKDNNNVYIFMGAGDINNLIKNAILIEK